ncbi:DUF4256 domain-containing protein [Flavobacterium sp. xlx-214]|uniref:DUF4256 domain-containing protein n=1 Tax=unclassified Flavobacterium TaxID=196869 RepID=UPI0013D240BB|nr:MULTISPECIES: DUF4256 domain-containing protein [unclassified Flavobacterium]MBA5793556.1 DUF4256 domain-containing protein [Flavobacterium sp. xlx-221]QMI84486.1 DUF4256 domain-containing protein [Flavobacterium sp. xlx-214]
MKKLTAQQQTDLLSLLQNRFESNKNRHENLDWKDVETKLLQNPSKLVSLHEMELTEGEPDVIAFDATTKEYIFCDCAKESPKGRRSYCYDADALNKRKEHKPKNNVLDVAAQMGITLLNEQQYKQLQQLGNFDTKTSSWIETPDEIRNLGGALFADFRYNTVFVYHNGAESYYAARGFRGLLKI